MMWYTLRKPELSKGMVSELCRTSSIALILCPAMIAGLFLNPLASVLADSKVAATSAKVEQGWHVEQKSSMVNDLILDVTPDYLCLQNNRAGTVTIARAPDWLLTTYNPTRKIYYSIRPEKFTGKYAMFSGSLTRSNMQEFKLRVEGKCGYKIGDKVVDALALRVLPSDEMRLKQNEEQVWNPRITILEDKLINKTAANLLCRLYILPPLGKLPLGCEAQVLSSSMSSNHKTKTIVKTTALQKRMIALNACPDLRGYKKSADENEFSNANNGNIELQDFTDYMGH